MQNTAGEEGPFLRLSLQRFRLKFEEISQSVQNCSQSERSSYHGQHFVKDSIDPRVAVQFDFASMAHDEAEDDPRETQDNYQAKTTIEVLEAAEIGFFCGSSCGHCVRSRLLSLTLRHA